MTDAAREQVGVWQGNAYGTLIDTVSLQNTIGDRELKNFTLAIFAAGTPKSTLKLMKELRQKNKQVKIIFDPGQSLSLYDKKSFAACLVNADFFISNDIEIAYCEKFLDFDLKKALGENKIIIETKGEAGSVIHEKDSKIFVPVMKPKKIVDVTGAGDAYRAGLLFGLATGKSLFEAGKMGSKVAAKCVEHLGAQEYKV